jgi:exodeoxyribonuclease VII large subunit
MITTRLDDVERLKGRSHAAINTAVVRAADQLVHLKAQVRALSPQKTLDRGYAVVQLADGEAVPGRRREVVRHPSQAPAGTDLTVRVAGGRFTAQSTGGQETSAG